MAFEERLYAADESVVEGISASAGRAAAVAMRAASTPCDFAPGLFAKLLQVKLCPFRAPLGPSVTQHVKRFLFLTCLFIQLLDAADTQALICLIPKGHEMPAGSSGMPHPLA